MNIQAGQLLTPAEAFALNQVLQSGRQTLNIGALGNAVGGTLSINGISGTSLGSLVIPHGVRVLDNVSASQLNLTGNLTNAGSLYLYSTNSSSPSALINAMDITNQRGGLLSSIVPASYLKGLSAISGLNLDLTALNNILNAGTIRSAGGIVLTAGNTINNTGIVSAAGTAGAVNLVSNNIVNSGRIQSLFSDINISAPNTATITVNNANGLLQALLGNINVRDDSFTAKSDFDLTGGNLLSKTLNINTGNGTSNIDVKNITGLVNINAGIEHLVAATPNLNIGTLNLTGDPTIYNLNGNINLTSAPNTTPGANLAIIASGNITSGGTANSFGIDTGSSTGNGGDIIIIAGAKITAPSGTASQNLTGDTATTFSIAGGSKTGGEIDFFTVPIKSLDSSSTFATGTGGDITIAAFRGSGAGSGLILLPAVQTSKTGALLQSGINLNAAGIGGNGNITIIGSAMEFAGIANGTTGAGANNVNILAANPTITLNGSNPILINNGQFATGSGSFNLNPTVLSTGNIVESSNVQPFGIIAKGNINIRTGGEMQLDNLTAGSGGSSGTITLQTAGIMFLDGFTQAPGNISISATKGGLIEYFGNIQSGTGNVTINGGSIVGAQHLEQQITNGTNWQFTLGATVDKQGNFVYVPDFNTGTITKLNAQTAVSGQSGSVVSTIQLNGALSGTLHPEGTVLSPDGLTLYVANSGDGTFEAVATGGSGSMTPGTPIPVKDTSGNPLPSNGPNNPSPEAVAVSPNGQQLYVLVNTAPVFKTQIVGGKQEFVLNPQTHTPVITSMGQATLLVYNISGLSSTSKPVAVIQLGKVSSSQTGGISVNPQGTFAYVSNSGSNSISVVNLSNLSAPVQSINLPKEGFEYPIFTAMNPNGTRLYVADGFSNQPFVSSLSQAVTQGSIIVVDTTLGSPTYNQFLANIPQPQLTHGSGTFPQGISVNPAGTELTVQSTYLNQINDVSTALNQLITATFTGAETDSLGRQHGSAPDGYGSSNFSGVVTVPGIGAHPIPIQTEFTSNTYNLSTQPGLPTSVPGSVSVMIKPTIQGSNISLTSTGNINVDYDVKGGTFTANAAGQVIANDLGSGGSKVGQSGAKSLFEIGATEALDINGSIKGSNIFLQTSGIGDITLNGTVGQSGGSVSIQTGTGNIYELANGLVVGKNVTLTSQSGDIDRNFTQTGFTSTIDPNNSTLVSSLQLTNTGQGPIRLSGPLLGVDVDGTLYTPAQYTFNDSTGVVTFTAGNEPNSAAVITVTSKTPFQTAAQTLTATTGTTAGPQSGSVYINNTAPALTLPGAAAGTTFQLATSGTVTIPKAGGINAPNVDLRSVGTVSIAGQIGDSTTPGTISITTGGKGGITNTAGTFNIIGDTLNLATGATGIGTASLPLRTEVNTLVGATAVGSATASIYLSNIGSIAVGNTAGTVTDPNPTVVSAPGTFSLTANSAPGGPASSFNISNLSGDLVNSNVLILNASGSIGALGAKFLTNANTVTVNAGTTNGDDAYIEASAPPSNIGVYTVTLKPSSAGGTFSLDTTLGAFNSTSNINVVGITAPIVSLTPYLGNPGSAIPGDSPISGGSVTLAGNINASTSTTITTGIVFTTNSVGDNLVGNAIVYKSGTILSPAVTLTTSYGNIGSAKAPISITAPTSGTSTVIASPGQTTPFGGATGVSQAFIKGIGNVNMSADGSGSVGAATNPINLSLSGNLTLTAPSGSAYVNVTSGNAILTAATTVKDVLSLTNSTGALSVSGSGAFTTTAPAEVDLSAKTNLTLSNANLSAATPNIEKLTAGGTLTLTNNITVASESATNTGDGGTISITAQSLVVPNSTLTLNANADNGLSAEGTHSNGGTINFTISGKQAFSISPTTPPIGTTQLLLEAAGGAGSVPAPGLTGDGGSVNVSVGGNVTVGTSLTPLNNGIQNAPGTGTGGLGGNTSIQAGGTLSVTGPGLNNSGDSGAADGTIGLFANGKTPFVIGQPSSNGVAGTLTGGNIYIGNAAGITLTNQLMGLSTVPTAVVQFNTNNLTIGASGSIAGVNQLIVQAPGTGSLSISGAGNFGTPAGLVINANGGNLSTGSLPLNLPQTISVEISAKGTVNLGASFLTVGNASSPPGSISIAGGTINFSGAGPHVLTATGNGGDGSVSFVQTGTQSLTVGKNPGNIEIDIQSSAGTPSTGGLIDVTSGGQLTVDAANGLKTDSTSATTGLSNGLILKSGAALIMTGFSQTLVGPLPFLQFGSKSAVPFTIAIGSNPANGVGLPSGSNPLTATTLLITNSIGSIGTSGPTGALNITAYNVAFNAGKSGLVNVTDSVIPGATVNLSNSGAGTSFTLNAGNAYLQSSGATISTPSLNLGVNNMVGAVHTNATTITGSTQVGTSAANFSVIDSATKTVNLNGIVNNGPPGSTGTISVQTSGPVNINGSVVADNVSVTSVGNITIGNHIGTTVGSGGTISLDTNGVGSITMQPIAAQNVGTIAGSSLTLSAGTGIGTSSAPLQTSVNTLNGADTPGLTGSASIYINNVGAMILSSTGSGISTPGTFSLTAGGTITVGQQINQTSKIFLTANGSTSNIVVSANFGSTPSLLLGVAGSNDTLIAGGDIVNGSGGTVRGNVITLSSGGTNGIGASGNAIQTTARTLNVNATGSVWVDGSDDNSFLPYVLTVNKSQAGGSFNISTSTAANNESDIKIAGIITAPTVSLTTGAGTNGSITATTAGSIAAPTVTLATGGGSIGTSAAPLKLTGVTLLSANATGNGSVALVTSSSTSGSGLDLLSSSSGGSFSLTDTSFGLTVDATGGITTSKAATPAFAGNNLTLIEKGGSINIDSNLTANGGNIVVDDTQNAASINIGAVSIATNVAITSKSNGNSAGNGQVTIAFGPIPATKSGLGLLGLPSFNVATSGSGQVFAGVNPQDITVASSGQANLTASSADIVFSVPNTIGGAINLSNGTSITADPTIIPSAPITPVTHATASPAVPIPGSNVAVATGDVFGSASGLTPAGTVAFAPAGTMTVASMFAPQSGLSPAVTTALTPAGTGAFTPAGTGSLSTAGTVAVATMSAQQSGLTPAVTTAFTPAGTGAFTSAGTKAEERWLPAGIGSANIEDRTTLLTPDKELMTQTPAGELTVAPGAAVLLITQGDGTVSIFNLHDSHSGDVKLHRGSREIVLTPGRHITIASQDTTDFASVNPIGNIAHRDLKATSEPGSNGRAQCVFASEFSIPSAIKAVTQLSALAQSNRKLADMMLRDAVILMQMHPGSAPYQRMGSTRPASKLALN
jgi:hypothetical protein